MSISRSGRNNLENYKVIQSQGSDSSYTNIHFMSLKDIKYNSCLEGSDPLSQPVNY
jgi:hypothetical protein